MSNANPNPTPLYKLPDDVIVENPEAVLPKRFEFQMPSGHHWEPEIVCSCGEAMINSVCSKCKDKAKPQLVPVLGPTNRPEFRDGKPLMRVLTKDVVYGSRRPAGDLVKTNSDLRQQNGVLFRTDKGEIKRRPFGPEMCVPVDANHRPDAAALSKERQRAERFAADRQKLLERMDRKQLAEYAESEGIDVRGAQKREDLLKLISEAQADLVLS